MSGTPSTPMINQEQLDAAMSYLLPAIRNKLGAVTPPGGRIAYALVIGSPGTVPDIVNFITMTNILDPDRARAFLRDAHSALSGGPETIGGKEGG